MMPHPVFKEELINHLPELRAFARSLARNPTKADDLVQDTLVKALANAEQFELGSNLRAWLFTILRNHFYSQVGRAKREVEDAEGRLAARLSVRPKQDGVPDLQDFKLTFARLGADQREVLTLVGAFGCSYEEAAGICGCAVGTIKSRVHRARLKLIELLGLSDDNQMVIADRPAALDIRTLMPAQATSNSAGSVSSRRSVCIPQSNSLARRAFPSGRWLIS